MIPEEMKAAPMGWFEVAARLKSVVPGLNERACSALQVMMNGKEMSDTTRVTFSRVDTYKRGPKKGERRWLRGDEVHEYVTRSEVAEVWRRYEAETGRCAHCNDGQACIGWSVNEGSKMAPCRRCGGSGKAATP